MPPPFFLALGVAGAHNSEEEGGRGPSLFQSLPERSAGRTNTDGRNEGSRQVSRRGIEEGKGDRSGGNGHCAKLEEEKEGEGPVATEGRRKYLRSILTDGLKIREKSKGCYSVVAGPITALSGRSRGTGFPFYPSYSLLENAANFDGVKFNCSSSSGLSFARCIADSSPIFYWRSINLLYNSLGLGK